MAASSLPPSVEAIGALRRPPFAGLRVLDLAAGVAGGETARLLAAWGADVIAIEAPDASPGRRAGTGALSPVFAAANAGKRSLALDPEADAGRRLLEELLRAAEVVIHDGEGGVPELEAPRLRELNPRAILLSSRLMGGSGPWGGWIGYGPNAAAVSALLSSSKRDAAEPALNAGTLELDRLAGLAGAIGVEAALIRRQLEGRGAHVEVARFEVLLQLIGEQLARESLPPEAPIANRARDEGPSPRGVFACLGEAEWCVIEVATCDQWRALCELLEQPGWAADPQYATARGRREGREQIESAIEGWTRRHSAERVTTILQSRGIAAAPVQHPASRLADPHLQARGFHPRCDQPGLGDVALPGPCFRSDAATAPAVRPAPLPGEHTREICGDWLGLSDDEIDRLRGQGVLGGD